jgi:MFS family permease
LEELNMEGSPRPLRLSEILDLTARIYRKNFVLFAGIYAVLAGTVLALSLLALGAGGYLKAHATSPTGLPLALGWVSVLLSGIAILVLLLLTGATTAAICRAVARLLVGETVTIGGAYASTLPRLGRYVGLQALIALVVGWPLILLFAGYGTALFHIVRGLRAQAGAAAQHAAANPHAAVVVLVLTGVFCLLLIPVMAYVILMGLRYWLAMPACVLEDVPALRAMRRSAGLGKGGRGRMFLFVLVVGAIVLVVMGPVQVLTIMDLVKHHGHMGLGMRAASEIMQFFTNCLIGPIHAIGFTLFYYDQRVRREGCVTEWGSGAAGLPSPEDAVGLMPPEGGETV